MLLKKTNTLFFIAILTTTTLFLLLGLMTWLAQPNTPVAVTPTETVITALPTVITSCDSCSVPSLDSTSVNTSNEQIVATINQQTITATVWHLTTQLDVVMSRLAQRPVPTAEETLDRLVNETLVLQAVPMAQQRFDEATVKERLAALIQQWQLTDQAVDQALQAAGLNRAALLARIEHLLQVELALQQLATQHDDVNKWLAEARRAAQIGLYDSLNPLASVITESIPLATATLAPTPPTDLAISPYAPDLAPDFNLPTLEGQNITLSQFRGRPVLLNFWATWCPPCRSELPALQAAYQKYQGQIGFVAVDVKEDAATVAAFVQQLGLTFPIALDHEGQVSDRTYEVLGIPTTLFIDKQGLVNYRHVGPLDETTLERYLTPLLGQPANVAPPPIETALSQPVISAELKTAPSFTLTAADGRMVSLADYRAKQSVILVFYRGHT